MQFIMDRLMLWKYIATIVNMPLSLRYVSDSHRDIKTFLLNCVYTIKLINTT